MTMECRCYAVEPQVYNNTLGIKISVLTHAAVLGALLTLSTCLRL